MRCHNAKSLISRSFDEPIKEFDRSQLEDHLQSCQDCATHLQVLDRGRELLHAGTQVAPSENFEWKVQLGIQKAMRDAARERYSISPRPAFWRPVLGGALGMAALVLVLGVSILPRLQSGPASEQGAVLSEASEPDLGGAQPVEIVDPLYVSSRGGQFVSGAANGPLPMEASSIDREDLERAVEYWYKVAVELDHRNQRLRSANEQLKLLLANERGDQR